MRLSLASLIAAIALPVAHAILVTHGSPCSTRCGNVLDATTPSDLTCSQGSYSSGAGQIFAGCVSCELSSGYSNEGQTDTQWMLYNLRYAVSYCLFGTPENDNVISTPCITTKACGPFRDAIEFKNMSSDVDKYDYCAVWPVTDHQDFKGCRECLRAGGQDYLANFVTVLQAGCEQQPVGGVNVAIEGSVFSVDHVNVTEPTPMATVDPSWFDQGPINLGAKVGIAIGGLVVILAALGFFIVWNGKRRRRAFLRKLESKHNHNGWPSPHPHDGMRETPLSQRPLRGWDDSPLSATTEKTFPRYFSPYSSQYNSPVSAQDGPSMPWPDPTHAANSPSTVTATVDQHGHWHPTSAIDSHIQPSGSSSEMYEMHEVESEGGSNSRGKQKMQLEPPVLGHPGNGRGRNSPPRMYDLEFNGGRA